MNSKISLIKNNFHYLLFGVLSMFVDTGCVTTFADGGFNPFIIVDIAGDEFGCCKDAGAIFAGT